MLNYENLSVSRFTLRLLQRHKWDEWIQSFLLNSVLRNRRQTEKTLIVKYTIKNFTCDLCVCEHISESRYFTSTPHASKNIKTPTGPPTTTGAIKAARVEISHHLLRNVILAKNVINNMAMSLTKILPGFTINILGKISVGHFFNTLQIRHSSDCAWWTKV